MLRIFRPVILVATVASALTTPPASAATVSLDSVLALTMVRNPDLRVAGREVEAARARLRQARSLDAPSASYEVGKLGLGGDPGERESSLRLSQSLPFPSQRNRSVRVAEAGVALAEALRESSELRIRRETTRAYRLLQADFLNLRALENLRSVSVDLEEMVRVRIGTGGARYLDLLRLRAERVRLANDLIESERALQEHRQSLHVLMAMPGDDPLAPADSLAFIPLADSLSIHLEEAIRSRPALKAARLELERERAGVAAAKAGLLPSTEVSFGLDWIAGVDRPGWGGEVALQLPFMPWTDRRGRVEEAEAAKGGAEAKLLAAERSLEATVRNAFTAVRSAERQLASFEGALLADAEDAMRAATQNYRTGQIDGLELFETLRSYRTIQIEHVRALLNYELARTDLFTAE